MALPTSLPTSSQALNAAASPRSRCRRRATNPASPSSYNLETSRILAFSISAMISKSFAQRLEIKQHEGEADIWEGNGWLNRDNVPLPSHRRTWGFWSYVGFWITTGVNVSGWAAGASLLGLGLTVGQAMGVIVGAQFIIVLVYVFTGQVGAYWHVGFPMWNRIVWGLRAAVFPLVNRIILSFTWTATQGWFGGQCLKVLIGSMAPGIYTMKNTLPASTYMESSDFMCFMLFTAITIPMILIPPERLHRPMIVVGTSSTIVAFALFIWSLARAHGGGPLMGPEGLEIVGVPPAKGSKLAWAVVYGISTSLGSICAGILNQSDYTRFASRPRHPFLSLGICQPLVGSLTALIGIVCASVAVQYYPDEGLLWNPYDLLRVIQLNGGKGARAAVFFCALSFTLAQYGINVPGNLIAGGIDLTSLWPRYINIRRGAYVTLAISVAMCPWALMNGSNTFLAVMSGYAVFLGPITGIMVFDYMLVHYRKIKLSALYESNSIYWYWKGVNWRAPVAWAVGMAPSFPGFLQSVGAVTVPEGAMQVYYLCWPLGFFLSGILYTVLCKIFPVAGVGEVDEYDTFGTFGEPETVPTEVIKEDEEPNAGRPLGGQIHEVL